jgi:hypothetical protein
MLTQLLTSDPGVPSDFIRGDANTDKQVQMNDATYVLRSLYVPGSPSPYCMDAADADDNGDILISDVMYLLRYIYLPEAPEPPAPFPVCGPDPTTDGLGCGWYWCGTGE